MLKLFRPILLLLSLLAVSTTAHAQSYRVGAQTVDYSAQTIGDGSTANGGTPPYFSSGAEPSIADQIGYTRSAWIGTGATQTGVGDEKFRITCNFAKFGSFDPILYLGQAKVGHHHTFFGAGGVDHNSNYTSLRTNAMVSTCPGGPLNKTAYWEPSMMRQLTSGAYVAFKPNVVSFYYVQNAGQGAQRQRLPRDFAFIGVANPMNYNDTVVRREIATAPSVSGSALMYTGGPSATGPPAWGGLGNHGTPAGLIGYGCLTNANPNSFAPVVAPHGVRDQFDVVYSPDYARYLKGPFGEDPWGGACTAGKLILSIVAPHCWDGVNPRSPDGRGHVRYAVRNQHSTVLDICPKNWYKVPGFEAKTEFEHNGWTADLQYRFLSSDRMRVSTTECPDATAPCDGVSGGNTPATVNGVPYTRVSNDPCRARTVDFCNGATAHFDWMGAWDQEVMNIWMAKCLNMAVPGKTSETHECNGPGTIDMTGDQALVTGTPPDPALAPTPVVDSSKRWNQNLTSKYAPVEVGQHGPFTGHGHKPTALNDNFQWQLKDPEAPANDNTLLAINWKLTGTSEGH